jgi:hypothetical protein
MRTVEAVLTGTAPRLTTTEAIELGATLFGIRARRARDLGSGRDRAFRLGRRPRSDAVLKV